MMEGGILPNPAPAAANSQTYKILHLPGLSYLHAIPVVHYFTIRLQRRAHASLGSRGISSCAYSIQTKRYLSLLDG